MRRLLSKILYGAVWLLTACAGAGGLAAAGRWWSLRRYLEKFGAAENPYAEEDAFMAGLCMAAMLVLFLCLLTAALLWRNLRTGKLVGPEHEDETAEQG